MVFGTMAQFSLWRQIPVCIHTPSTNGVCPDDVANYTITFADGPSVTSVNADCTGDPSEYTVSFDISGGAPPYEVSGGVVTGNTFVSDPISVASGPSNFSVIDANNCESVMITASIPDTDGDGICDAGEIVGCQDPTAANYNPLATDPGNCIAMVEPEIQLDESGWSGENPGSGFGGGSVDLGAKGIQLLVFPNPAMNDEVTIKIRGIDPSSDNGVLTIRDVLGNIRFEKELKAENGFVMRKVSIEDFANGVYLIQLVSGGEVVVGRLVVNR